jgi:hypothetical protein
MLSSCWHTASTVLPASVASEGAAGAAAYAVVARCRCRRTAVCTCLQLRVRAAPGLLCRLGLQAAASSWALLCTQPGIGGRACVRFATHAVL